MPLLQCSSMSSYIPDTLPLLISFYYRCSASRTGTVLCLLANAAWCEHSDTHYRLVNTWRWFRARRGVHNDIIAPAYLRYVLPDSMVMSSHGNTNAFSVHISHPVGSCNISHRVSENILLQGDHHQHFQCLLRKRHH